MSEVASKVPQLRFSEFSGAWELKRIGDISQVSSGGTPSRSNSNYWDGNIPWVSTTLINFNKIDKSNEYISKLGLQNSSAKIFPKNTILLAMYGQGKTRGKVAILKIEASTNQACAAIITNTNTSSSFLFQYLSGQYDDIRNLSNEGGQKNLSGGLVKSIMTAYPAKPEQQKIASFLTAVDNKIEQLSKKQALLGEYKKGLMQKIFSQAIRFNTDDGSHFPDWQENKLGDVFLGLKGRGLSKKDITEGGENKCVLYGELYTTYPEVIKKVVSRTNLEDGVKSKVGDLLVPCSTTTTGIDLADVTAINKDNVSLGGDISILRLKKDGNSVFFAYYLTHYKNFDLAKYGQGSTIVHLYYNHFKKINLKFPSSVEEQTKIANFLSSIDNKIEQVGKQLDESKQFKKALLQQMFVS